MGIFFQSGDDYTLMISNEEAFDGSSSLSISSETTDNQSFAFWNTSITSTEIGKIYKVKARIKGKDLDVDSFSINMFARNRDNTSATISGLSGELSPGNDWQEITVQLVSPITTGFDSVDVYFLLGANATGTVYIDKVELFFD